MKSGRYVLLLINFHSGIKSQCFVNHGILPVQDAEIRCEKQYNSCRQQ